MNLKKWWGISGIIWSVNSVLFALNGDQFLSIASLGIALLSLLNWSREA